MRRNITQLVAAGAAAAVLSALTVTAASAAAAVTRPPQLPGTHLPGVSQRLTAPGTRQWVSRYNGTGNGFDAAKSVAVSPDGDVVFVTGVSTAAGGPYYVTVAYRAATGAQVWLARYGPSGGAGSFARSMAVSPDGTTVFVTGDSNREYATVAYNAATGAQLWAAQTAGPGVPAAVAVSPSGGTVFVTGFTASIVDDINTVAYSAATGTQLWAAHWASPSDDIAYAMAVSPDGGTVFVTGSTGAGEAYITLAYDATTGAKLWQKTYKGPSNDMAAGRSVAVSPDGSTVYVTGDGAGARAQDCVTIAYDAATGARKWLARYSSLGTGHDVGAAVLVSRDGGTIFVTGYTSWGQSTGNYLTIAYDAATGGRLWLAHFTGPGNNPDVAAAAALSPDGGMLYVTGQSWRADWANDYATVAYSTVTGARLWAARYGGTVANGEDDAVSLAVSPDGSQVFVTGNSAGAGSGDDYATVAYSG